MIFQAKILKKLSIYLLFAKSVWVATGISSIIIWSAFGFSANQEFALFFGFILILKIIINALIYWLFHQSKAERYLFYQNLGISKSALWVFTFSIDLFISPISIFILSISL